MARSEIEVGGSLRRVAGELNKLKGQKGPAQGSVDHFKIKPGERKEEGPKITKIFQEMGKEQENTDLVVFDVKRGIKVEEDTNKKGRPINKVFQEIKSRR